jgi:hypothetical protein
MLQGTADREVPAETALRLLDHAAGDDIRLTLVKDATTASLAPLPQAYRAGHRGGVVIPPLPALDAWLADREARVPRCGRAARRRMIWADGPRRTDWSVVYVHGFSASRREASPWPERVAEALGANFFGARLTGHGQDGPAMDRATLRDWRADTAEALAIGRAVGERLLVLSCSTGSTL